MSMTRVGPLVIMAIVSGATLGHGDVWDSHAELRAWVSALEGSELEPAALVESEREFLRITFGAARELPILMMPGDSAHGFDFSRFGELAELFRYEQFNAVRVTLRSNLPFDSITGRWVHSGWELEELPADMPSFRLYPLANSNEWETITLRLSDSPDLEVATPIVLLSFAVVDTRVSDRGDHESVLAAAEGAVLDLDRIELVNVEEEPRMPPTITALVPARGVRGSLVVLEGSEFGDPTAPKRVFFDDIEAEIVGGDDTHLEIRASGYGRMTVTVRTAGGGRAVAPQEFVFLGVPFDLVISGGANQVVSPGAESGPLVVKVVDRRGEGLPGHAVAFTVVSGDGTLSIPGGNTDENGDVQTTVIVGSEPGEVVVRAHAGDEFYDILFTIIIEG